MEAPKDEVLDQQLQADDIRVRELGPDIAFVTYLASKPAVCGLIRNLRSSLWNRDGVVWRTIFHQGTRIPD